MKSKPLKIEKSAEISQKQITNNFEKVQNTTYVTSKIDKTRKYTWQKMSFF